MSETSSVDRDPHELLSVEHVSKELGVHPVTVRDWLRRGLLVGSKPSRRAWRVQRQALQNFVERGGLSTSVEDSPTVDRYAPPTGYAAGVIDTLSPREGSS